MARFDVRSTYLLFVPVAVVACASPKSESAVRPATRAGTSREVEMQRRIDRLELRVIEKEAQVEELQTRLQDTREEVVRAMAKLETGASRAEAASGMAEAEVALQSLRVSTSGQQIPELPQAQRLVQQSSSEFNKQNFGGALYLASVAKSIAASGRTRLAAGNRAGSARPGETAFALPIRLKVDSRGNVREGPGTNYATAFAVDRGRILTGYSHADEWVRVSDESGRSGWISRSLVGRP